MAIALELTFQVVYGHTPDEPLCCLLTISGSKVLLDCGWDAAFSEEYADALRHIAPDVDAVLLSHGTVRHLGMFPRAVAQLGLSCPVYATVPVHRMGQVALYEAVICGRDRGRDMPGTAMEDVDKAFATVQTVQYQQPVVIGDPARGITATAHPSGHSIGGSVWCVSVLGEDVIYAPTFTHRRGVLLEAANLEAISHRPAALVVGAPLSTGLQTAASDAQRDRAFLDAVVGTLRGDGSVLVPCDASARVLEVLALLDAHWQANRELHVYSLVFLSHTCRVMVDFAATQLEWVRQDLIRGFGADDRATRGRQRDNPLSFRHVSLATSVGEALGEGGGQRWRQGVSRVVVATQEDLEGGMAQEVLERWAASPRNLVAFPGLARRNTTAANVLARAAYAKEQTVTLLLPSTVEMPSRMPGGGGEGAMAGQGGGEGAEGGEAAAAAGDVHSRVGRRAIVGMSLPVPGLDLAGGEVDVEMDLGESHAGTKVPGEGRVRRGYIPGWDCTVHGFEVPADALAPMFPGPDEDAGADKEWDLYGESVREGEFAMLRGREAPALMEGAGGDGAQLGAQLVSLRREWERARQASAMPPAPRDVAFRARTAAFDFAGASDPDSVAALVTRVAPRAVVVTHGEPGTVRDLKQVLVRALAAGRADVRAPTKGEAVPLHAGTCALPLELPPVTLGSLRMRAVGNYEVAFATGVLRMEGSGVQAGATGGAGPKGEGAGAGAGVAANGGPQPGRADEALPRLVVLGSEEEAGEAAGGVFIGDVKLSELRSALSLRGIRSAFVKGALVCDGRIVIHRNADSGAVEVEGPLSAKFYEIRDAVYGQYSIC